MRRLSSLRSEILTSTVPVALNDETLFLRNTLNGDESQISEVTCLTYATPRQVDDSLIMSANGSVFFARSIGDCDAPRGMAAAIHSGHEVGITM